MEWDETTGRTVEEALDAALDELGVDESDAEYEVVEEPKVGLFGRLRGEARVRARVRPTKPRPKEDRRDRRRRGGAGNGNGSGNNGGTDGAGGGEDRGAATATVEAEAEPAPAAPRKQGGRGRAAAARTTPERSTTDREERDTPMSETGVDVPVLEQGEVAAEFLRGLVDRFGMDATVAVRPVD